LQGETTKLSTALSTTRTAGTWGELQLRRVVELAGMQSYCDFTEQETSGALRPDLVVRLPRGQQIVVDAKAPTDAFREAASAADPKVRAEKLNEHAAKVRGHVDALSAKAYWEQFQPSPEFVVLFLPGDQFLAAALEADPNLVDRAIRSRVLLATPSTLIALLKAAAYGWRQEAVSENAEKISALGRELFDRICKLAEHFTSLGKNLNQAVAAYNKAAGTLETRVLVSARRFKELGASPDGAELEPPPQVDQLAREPQAPELQQKADAPLDAPASMKP
jgi:DNA recombination protein RmuC